MANKPKKRKSAWLLFYKIWPKKNKRKLRKIRKNVSSTTVRW